MKRETIATIAVLSETPIETARFGAVRMVSSNKIRELRQAKGKVVEFGEENGRKYLVLLYGGVKHLWFAGHLDGEPTDDFPIPMRWSTKK